MTKQHPNYYRDTYRGATIWRCCQCDHDTFNEDSAIGHQRLHPTVTLDYKKPPLGISGLRIAIGTISSSSDHLGIERHLRAIHDELKSTEFDNIHSKHFWVDNASGFNIPGLPSPSTSLDYNRGQSVARNIIIEQALGYDYLIFVDGDIKPVRHSFGRMASWINRTNFGCFGLYSRNCTNGLDMDSRAPTITDALVCSTGRQIAWTQYGIFDCRMFRDGLRFDDSQVFQGQGWGFEDDDLYCQMLAKGWRSAHTKYIRYGHYNLHSSLNAMPHPLAAKVWSDRKSYVFNKWVNNPLTEAYVNVLVNQTMPVDIQP